MRHEVSEEHVDEAVACSGPEGLLRSQQSQYVAFMGFGERRTLTCDPAIRFDDPDATVGARSTWTCDDGEGTTADVVVTLLERGRRTVGGQQVDATRTLVETTFRGSSVGTSRVDLWQASETGLALQFTRHTDTTVETAAGSTRYQESSEFSLQSMTPLT